MDIEEKGSGDGGEGFCSLKRRVLDIEEMGSAD